MRTSHARDWAAAVTLAAVAAFLAWLVSGPWWLLVVALVSGMTAVILTVIIEREKRTIGLPSAPRNEATPPQLRTLVGLLVTSGGELLDQIESSPVHQHPVTELFQKFWFADLAYQWDRIVQQTYGRFGPYQYEFRRDRIPVRTPPAGLAPNLRTYWDLVAWRLEWINDRMDQLSPRDAQLSEITNGG